MAQRNPASADLGQLRYIPETDPGVTPTTGNGINLRTTQPTMRASITTIKSNEISADRMVRSSTVTDVGIEGGFDFELSGKEYDFLWEAIMRSNFVHFGTNGLGDPFTLTATAAKLTAGAATAGNSIFTKLVEGSWFKVIPPSTADRAVKDYFADAWFKVGKNSTATDLMLDPATPVKAPGLVSGVAGFRISQSTLEMGKIRKTFTLEWDQQDIGEFLTYKGMEANTMSLDFQIGAIVTGSASFMGISHTVERTTALPGTPKASFDLDPLNSVADIGELQSGGRTLLQGSDFISSLRFEINNNLRGLKALGYLGNAGVGVGSLDVTGSFEAYFHNSELYKKWWNSEQSDLVFGVADNQGNGYLIELPKIKYREGSLNNVTKNNDPMLTLSFDAFYDGKIGRGIRITRSIAAA